jgi:hypothetical protein
MPAATPLSVRQQIFDLTGRGLGAAEAARLLALPARTVRRLAARFRLPDAAEDLAPYAPPGRGLAGRLGLLGCCLALRRDNPGWGAGRIRLEMLKLHPALDVPPRAPSRAGCAKAASACPPSSPTAPTAAAPASRTRSGRWTRWSACGSKTAPGPAGCA